MSSMEVFLIPLGRDRHEPYCEVPDDDGGGTPSGGGLFRTLVEKFRQMLSAAEQQRQRADVARGAEDGPQGWRALLKARFFRWLAERIAEQRLLWHLRRQDAVVLVHPADLHADRARQVFRDSLWRDRDRHRRWLVANALLFVASGLLAILPGPNLVAYYFAFRVVGHYLSFRGARHGLEMARWEVRASEALTDLRRAIDLDPAVRQVRVLEIAARLELQHLARFFERMRPRGA
jgi:hypothetical protein